MTRKRRILSPITGTFNLWTLLVVGVWVLIVLVAFPPAEAKRRKYVPRPPLHIVELATSPTPWEIGVGELQFRIVVQVPAKLDGANFLEITTLISSPTRRSIRFLTERLPLSARPNRTGKRQIHLTVGWDGKDQTEEFVAPGIYRYEVRAKLMVNKGEGARTRVVSRRSRGTVEVVASRHVEDPLHGEGHGEVEEDEGAQDAKGEIRKGLSDGEERPSGASTGEPLDGQEGKRSPTFSEVSETRMIPRAD